MTKLRTNRDLYRFATELCRRRADSDRTLEQYLLRLWLLLSERVSARPLTLAEFANLLDASFAGTIPAVPGDWFQALPLAADDDRQWHSTLAHQIVDLREMYTAGILDDEMRYFGVDAPRGGRWYNFDPRTFIECGITGAFGGWSPDDDSSRQYVPGQVAVLDADGNLTTANPEDIDEPIYALESISWPELDDFLECGQCYE